MKTETGAYCASLERRNCGHLHDSILTAAECGWQKWATDEDWGVDDLTTGRPVDAWLMRTWRGIRRVEDVNLGNMTDREFRQLHWLWHGLMGPSSVDMDDYEDIVRSMTKSIIRRKQGGR